MKTLFWLASVMALMIIATAAGKLPAQEIQDEDVGDVAMHMHEQDRKSTRLNSSHSQQSRMPSSA